MQQTQIETVTLSRCNCLSLRRAARRISNFYDARLAPSGLRTTQYSILLGVSGKDPISINELASLLDLDRTTAGQNLRPLERAGLINLTRSPTDGRSWVVSLTLIGRQKLEQAVPLWHRARTDFEALNGADPMSELRVQLSDLSFE